MVGKTQFNRQADGDPGGFYPKLAKAFCEGAREVLPGPPNSDTVLTQAYLEGFNAAADQVHACPGSLAVVQNPAPPPPDPLGPYETDDVTWWIDPTTWRVLFNIDADPEPDVGIPINDLLNNTNISDAMRDDVREVAEDNGWPG